MDAKTKKEFKDLLKKMDYAFDVVCCHLEDNLPDYPEDYADRVCDDMSDARKNFEQAVKTMKKLIATT